jgi:hypothetical protein
VLSVTLLFSIWLAVPGDVSERYDATDRAVRHK